MFPTVRGIVSQHRKSAFDRLAFCRICREGKVFVGISDLDVTHRGGRNEIIDYSADDVENGFGKIAASAPLIASIEAFVFLGAGVEPDLPFVISPGFVLPPGLFL